MTNGPDVSKQHVQTNNQHQPAIRPHQREDVLKRLYHQERLSQYEIGDRFGVSQPCIQKWMEKYGIETRRCNVNSDEQPNGPDTSEVSS